MVARSRVGFVLKGYPRLSETFIAQEIRALERRGLEVTIVSLRHPTDPEVHPVHREIEAPLLYLPEYLYQEPLRVLRAWWRVRRRPGYRAARAVWLRDLRRDRTPNRVRRFGQALVLAAELDPGVGRLHAHFIHTPASVTRYAGLLSGRPWSCSAHAKDIWTTPDWEKREKLAAADWTVTCTAYGAAHLTALAESGAGGEVALVYHGLDLTRFPAPAEATASRRDGSDPAAPVILLSVGRAVEKKGYDLLLRALAALPTQRAWRLVHIGGGPLRQELRRLARDLGLEGRIEWRGPRAQAEVLAAYRAADLFVLASRVAGNGDRDGLPNVLVEAQSQALACVASEVAAIPELIAREVTGLLVPPEAPAALASALDRLIRDPALRRRLGQAGARRVRQAFDLETCVDDLARRFGLAPEGETEGQRLCASPSTPR
ncbi:MAG: glycosyltransferase family 4 protein [Kiloniellales bacterium]|nr:glycosyltransferase family 4 protein [Kiloniellales bacterium]